MSFLFLLLHQKGQLFILKKATCDMLYFNISYGWVAFYSVYMQHTFFIGSYIGEPFGCLHGLVTVNSAAPSIGVRLSL